MKAKNYWLSLLLFVCVFTAALAQEKNVTGTVTDQDGLPLPGVSILVVGTNNGTQSDFDGNYSIMASTGQVLRFSYIGQKTVERTIGTATVIHVSLEQDTQALEEVVVTALGIARDKKSLGYATQSVQGDEVSTVKAPNFVNSLSGKVAGIDIKSSGTLGGSSNVIIRGYSSINNSNQALFVVDGVPISNINNNGGNQQTGRGGYDYGNAAADINPEDIESINVLKGGAATALYGYRASNGVIVITTKKGKRNRGIGVTINSSTMFNKYNPDTFAKYQNEYGAGYIDAAHPGGFYFEDQNNDGIDEAYTLADWDGSFGIVPFNSNLLVHQWNSFYPQLKDTYGKATPWVAGENGPESVFETGVTLFNSISLDGGSEKGQFKIGFTKLDQKGIMPNSKINRDNFDFYASHNLTEKLTASAKVTYIKTKGKGRYGTGYDSQNFMQTSRQWWQTNVDVQEQKRAYFDTRENITWNTSYINDDLHPIYHDNVYWMRYENYETDLRNRVFGNTSLNYQLTDWLDVFARVSLDTYSGNQEERINNHSTSVSQYSIYYENFNEMNYDVMFNFDKDLSDKVNFRGTIGTNIMRQRYSSFYAITNGGINVDRLYALSNSANPINAPTQYEYLMGVDGYYANASLGYDDLVFLEGSYRYDISSTLPSDNNSYDYYGISGSFVFSELIDSNILPYGKVRLGYAKTGNSARPLTLFNTYNFNSPVGGQPSASAPSTNNNANLSNESSEEKEIGLEMSFINKRFGFDLSLYDKRSFDLLNNIAVTPAIGYSGQWINTGEMENKGVEVALWATPLKSNDFSWDVNISWGQNKNKVLSLPRGLPALQLASVQSGLSINAVVGEPFGTLYGSDFVYLNGKRVINESGNYEVTESQNENLGTFQPEWKGGLKNTFKYKSLSLSFLIDMQKGGKVFSLDTWYGMATGLYPETAGLNELGNPKRTPVTDGPDSGGILLDGVQADGTTNTIRARMDYYANTLGYARAPHALHVYDASYVKLREVALSYSLPSKLLSESFFKGITLSATGRNLWIIHKNMPYSDPEAGLSSGNLQGYQSGAYPSTQDYGFSVKLEF
ncbi:SusC/RagA family TonB-linked outer membrane protein [Allomuricauda sp. NBRC 101325]|uniref:SusC/RagA family TonB-linked outer membrane protein n=1 Tax=Allomuricauda sp. NBRC 101325 TaxID=1113758 RepID=UPI0024A0A003|nr:SusC/RagA family TonB-linked outer membrane protein [Muricauda sp. NBRC 101325]GLU43663.1 SusC/RagA family TonB-linked outer membrane protein [Muricauda sp. NBRC 101325]